jgi:hypothetical protein
MRAFVFATFAGALWLLALIAGDILDALGVLVMLGLVWFAYEACRLLAAERGETAPEARDND